MSVFKKIMLMSLFVLVFSESGWAIMGWNNPPVYNANIIKDDQFQREYVATIASQSENFADFLNKIYALKAEKINSGGISSFLITRESAFGEPDAYSKWEEPRGKRYDIEVFRTYCGTKNGKVYKWQTNYTCEVNNEIVMAQGFNARQKSNILSNFYHETYYYVDGKAFYEYFQRRDFPIYSSNDGDITIRPDPIHAGSLDFNINLTNHAKAPIDINMLNSRIFMKGAEYKIRFKDKPGLATISLNPDESFVANANVNVKYVTENDILASKVVLDTEEYSNFKRISPYEVQRQLIQDTATIGVEPRAAANQDFSSSSYQPSSYDSPRKKKK